MKPPKRPRDPAQLAKLMVDIATGEVDEGQLVSFMEKPAPQKLGGIARSEKLTPKQRSSIAKNAAEARWSKHQNKSDA